MKYCKLYIFLFFISISAQAQNNTSLKAIMGRVNNNVPGLQENTNLYKIGKLQNNIIRAQNNAFAINITSEVLVAPYFNNNGKFIDINTNPSPEAYGYDVGITNGGLYSAQLNITKSIFNHSVTSNLLFQNRIKNGAIQLSSEEILHNLTKNITEVYIMAFQLQLKEDFTKEILKDLEKRLEVVAVLVKHGILMESDYLLLELDIDQKKLELQQIEGSFKKTTNDLYTLVGIPIEKTKRLSAPNLDWNPTPQKFYYERKFINDSLQVTADQQVFQNQYKPQVSVYGNTGLNAVEIPNIDHKFGASAGVKLVIPIYDGLQRKYTALQNELKFESLQYSKKYKKTEKENKLKSIQDQLVSLKNSQQLLEVQLKRQERVLEIYKGKLVQGQVSIIDYLNVVQNYKMNVFTNLQMQSNVLLLQNQYNFTNW